MRELFLHLARNRTAGAIARRFGPRLGADKFVAGETIEAALRAVRSLNAAGLSATLDHLGEFVTNETEAVAAKDYCLQTLDAVREAGVESQLSVKLTQLGLDVDRDLCLQNMRAVAERALTHGNFVCIDMEDSGHCQKTLDLLGEIRRTYDNVGTVMQAYLHRALEDTRVLAAQGVPLRIVKGAYKESAAVAYPDRADVDANYKRLVEASLGAANYTAIATHDESLIQYARVWVDMNGICRNRFEFQMLYGIRPGLQKELAAQGYRVRIYVPFGTDWYGYFMRRLAERPANVGFVLRSLWRG